MIALRMVLSHEAVIIGRPYLARIEADEYVVVYPKHPVIMDGLAPYKECEFYCDSGETFSWGALRELAEIF